jgi:hypothetical protein
MRLDSRSAAALSFGGYDSAYEPVVRRRQPALIIIAVCGPVLGLAARPLTRTLLPFRDSANCESLPGRFAAAERIVDTAT